METGILLKRTTAVIQATGSPSKFINYRRLEASKSRDVRRASITTPINLAHGAILRDHVQSAHVDSAHLVV